MNYKRRNFTLIEILTVVMIIGILMTIAFFAYGRILETKYKRTADMQIQAMSTAIDDFYEKNGYWPPDSSETLSTETSLGNEKFSDYFNYDKFEMDSGVLKDPWGNDYYYKNDKGVDPNDPSKPHPNDPNNDTSYDLRSNGKDGVEGGGDDITNY